MTDAERKLAQILSLPTETKALVLDFLDLLLICADRGIDLPPVPAAKTAGAELDAEDAVKAREILRTVDAKGVKQERGGRNNGH